MYYTVYLVAECHKPIVIFFNISVFSKLIIKTVYLMEIGQVKKT